MIRTIKLHGKLATDTGIKTLKLDVDTPLMMVRGLTALVPGFEESLRSLEVPINIIAGNRRVKKDEKKVKSYSAKGLRDDFGKNKEVHIVPAVEGAALMTAYMIMEWGMSYAAAALVTSVVISMAVNLVIGAITQALAPKPNTSTGAQSVDQRPSFIFNGPVNITAQGYAIPLVYGTCLVGSTVISSGYDAVDLM